MTRAIDSRKPRLKAVILFVCGMIVCMPAWALQRSIKTKVHNYPNTPVEVKRSQVTLVESFSAPTQSGLPDTSTRKSHVRYVNQDGHTASTFELDGEVLCVNKSSQAVEAVGLTIVALDAFRQPIQLPGKREAYAVQQVVEPLPRGVSKSITWQQAVASTDVYEVVVVITRVRFIDGSVWSAPGEELIDIF